VSAALALIERTGSHEAVTLRAVAREVGIAAPSIYAHFPDRDAIVMAVVVRIFDQLTEAIEQGMSSAGEDPVGRLVAGCEAYVARASRPLWRAVL
jgi:AcrR family transcriptional regulator